MTRPRIGGYEILRALKSGGMGEVLLARRQGADGFEKLVAIKTVRSDLREMDTVRAMFADEARLVSRIEHPAVAQVHDFGEDGGALYLVMEYVAGVSFRELIESEELRPAAGVACRAIADACQGLHAAHELTDLAGRGLGVVHRDVSPENLMLTFDGRVKVLDFGIALMRDRRAPVTEYGAIKGKPPYLAPEQIKNERLDRRTDVFATCVVLHELITAEPLFRGDSVYAVAHAIEQQAIAPPSARAGPLPVGLDDVVMRGLCRDPADRWATALELGSALELVADADGADSLEAFARRALSERRLAHRRALRRTLGGDETTPLKARRTGAMTALAMSASGGEPGAADERAGQAAAASGGAGGKEALSAAAIEASSGAAGKAGAAAAASGGTAQDDAAAVARGAPSRQRAAGRHSRWLAAGVLIAAATAGVAVWLTREPVPPAALSQPVAEAHALPEEPPAITAPAATGAPAAEPTEAPLPANEAAAATGATATNTDETAAREGRRAAPPGESGAGEPARAAPGEPRAATSRRDSRRTRPRERPARTTGDTPAAPPPAAPESTRASAAVSGEPARGTGYLTVAANPFALVRINGKEVGTTPIFRHRLPAGRHEIVLASPDSGAVRLRRSIDLAAGATETIIAE